VSGFEPQSAVEARLPIPRSEYANLHHQPSDRRNRKGL
jgi:hypothetical protein